MAAEVDTGPSTAETQPDLPDYLTDPDAVLKDVNVKWRYGRAPDYSKTRTVFDETKQANHAAGSLPELVQNLVKNWEVEASFKPRLSDWRTIDHANYTFAINGGPPQAAEYMLKVGTYNAIISPNEYYSPEHSDFASSHKTFKRMMPTFAWEVVEVYSGPPVVAFRWRHWGVMKNDYVGFNDKGEKVTAKAHGGSIDIEGVTVAHVDDQVRLQKVETWFDPLEMFRQIAPGGIVNKEAMPERVSSTVATSPPEPQATATMPLDEPCVETAGSAITVSGCPMMPLRASSMTALDDMSHKEPETSTRDDFQFEPDVEVLLRKLDLIEGIGAPSDATSAESPIDFHSPSDGTGSWGLTEPADEGEHPDTAYDPAYDPAYSPDHAVTHEVQPIGAEPKPIDGVEDFLYGTPEPVQHPKEMEEAVRPEPGEAVAAASESAEAKSTHDEMSKITPSECPFFMNRE